MTEIPKEIRKERAQFQDLAFKVFALVGFLSSIVTIVSWITSTQSSLSAVVTPTTIEMPTSLQISNAVESQVEIGYAISELRDKFCNPISAGFDGSKSKNYTYSQEKCNNHKSIFEVITKIIELDGKKLLAWDVDILNDGQSVAENITLRSAVPVNVRAIDTEGNSLAVKVTSSSKVFTLPNLNPKEAMKVRITSSTPMPSEAESKVGAPKVTYSGGIASSREYARVSGRYSAIVESLDDMPNVLQIIVILFVSFFITIIWLIPISLMSEAAEKRKRKASSAHEEQIDSVK